MFSFFSVLSLDGYKVLFLAELFVAEILFTFPMEKRRLFPLRLFGGIAVSLAAAFFIPVFYYEAWYASLIFFALFLLSLGILVFCYKENFFNILFCAIAAYSIQHIAYQTFNMLLIAFSLTDAPLGIYGDVAAPHNYNVYDLPVYILSYFLVYWLAFCCLRPNKKDWGRLQVKSATLLVFVGLLVVIEIVINAIVTYHSYALYDKTYVLTSSLGSIVCCVLALWVQFNLLAQKKLKNELESIYHLYHQEQKQFSTSKTNIDLINRKCHDMKYQIRLIGQSGEVREDVIRAIEDCISIYDLAVKTGNKTLDTILTEKSFLCRSNRITFTCVLDGSRLAFMEEIDLFTLFGNAIDNAVEAVMKLEEKQRVISLTGKCNKNLFSVCLRNFFDGELKFEGGLPKTTKSDENYHGFGMRSIREIVEKYGGDIEIFAEENVFNLSMLFLLPSDEGEMDEAEACE